MMVRLVFVDTSAFYALAKEDAKNHEVGMSILAELRKNHVPLYTTNFVVAEAYGLILLRCGRAHAQAFLNRLHSGAVSVIQASESDQIQGEAILSHYADQDFSYVDAVSFAVIERLRIRRAFAFDKHFAVFRPSSGPLVLNR